MGGLAIRPAGPQDAEAVAIVHVRSWQAAYRGLLPDAVLDGLSAEGRAEMWRAQLSEASETGMWVAETADAAAGFVAAGPQHPPTEEGTAEVYAIYVAPERYRTGVGTALLTRAVEELKKAGFRQAVLWALAGNEAADRFYRANGWQPDGATKVDEMEGLQLPQVRYRTAL